METAEEEVVSMDSAEEKVFPEKCHQADPSSRRSVGSTDSGRAKVRHSIGSQTSDLPQTGASRWIHIGVEQVRSWLTNYLLDWRLADARDSSRLCKLSSRLATIMNESDVACFLKPGGLCPFCNLATTLLLDVQKQHEFSLHLADLMADEREVLSILLAKQKGSHVNVTFPAIFVGGEWLPGGYHELKQKFDSKELFALLDAVTSNRKLVSPLQAEDVPKLPSTPQLCHQAGGGTPLTFQTKIYGNVLRGIALLQICMLLPVHSMLDSENRLYMTPLLSVLFVDSLLFILVGPTPFAPLGILSTMLVWHRRGSVRPLLPYKVTSILYLAGSMGLIACPRDGEKGFVCDAIGGDYVVWTMIMNSIYLAIFCF